MEVKLVCSNIAEQSNELYDNKVGHPLHNCRVNFRNMPRLKITFEASGTWWDRLGKSLYMLWQITKLTCGRVVARRAHIKSGISREVGDGGKCGGDIPKCLQ